jgi:hypothetical protein
VRSRPRFGGVTAATPTGTTTANSEDRMKERLHRLYAIALVAGLSAGLAGMAYAQGPSDEGPEGYGTTPSQASQSAPELPVLYVTSVEIVRTKEQPQLDIVRVRGVTSSKGWSNPQLVPLSVGKPLDDVLDMQFIATTPLESQKAEGFVPIGAVFVLQRGHPFKGVRVRASENALEVAKIPGEIKTTVKVNDCHDCVGKKFAEKGRTKAGEAGVIRQEDLPKVLRWIIPTRGVRGITHNPNRLNLVLGPDNTIIEAFWE